MSAILANLFERRAELLDHISAVDALIIVETKVRPSSAATEPGVEYAIADNSIGSMPTSEPHAQYYQMAQPQNAVPRLPRGTTMKASAVQALTNAGPDGMTIREIKESINATHGAGIARNIDQIVASLIKDGKAKSQSKSGERNRYSLLS